MFKAAQLSQDLTVTKSYFECSIWILSVMHTVSYNPPPQKKKKKAVILMLIQVCFLLHGQMFCHKWKELTLVQADALQGEHTLH